MGIYPSILKSILESLPFSPQTPTKAQTLPINGTGYQQKNTQIQNYPSNSYTTPHETQAAPTIASNALL
jgi:hypothetical protein